jgi:glycosyltransferase involved in cell wall biosynthesis
MMMLSIIIPMFNSRDYINKCLYTVINQRCDFDYEIIVIDDCSTDDSEIYVRNEFGSRVNLIVNDKNMGPSYCRNMGIKAAKGKYIALVDSDDWIDLDRMKILVDFAERNNCTICSDGNINVSNNHKMKSIYPYMFFFGARRFNIVDFVKYDFGPLKPIINKNYINQRGILYDENMKYSEDFDFYFRILLTGIDFWFINIYLNYRLIHEGSLSNNVIKLKKESFLPVVNYLRVGGLSDELKIELLKRAKRYLLPQKNIVYFFSLFYKSIYLIIFVMFNNMKKYYSLKKILSDI